MPDLDQLFKRSSTGPDAWSNAQVFEARVSRVTDKGAFVVVPRFRERGRRPPTWGPCLPADAAVDVGDVVAIAMSNEGRPWIVAAAKQTAERSEHG